METDERDETFLPGLTERPELLERIQVFAHRPQLWLDESRWDEFMSRRGGILPPAMPEASETQTSRAAGRSPSSDSTNQQGSFTSQYYWIAESIVSTQRVNSINSNRSQSRLGQMLVSEFALEPIDYSEFADRSNRFALLGGEILKKLAFSVGLMRTSPALASAISGDQVSRIVDQIGEANYRAAIERGPLTVGSDYAGVPISAEDMSVNLRTAITRVGWSSLARVLANASDAIGKRLHLSLSADDEREFHHAEPSEQQEPGLADLMVRILKNNVNRRAALCVF